MNFPPHITPERALALYRTMARIRAFENAAEEASRGGVAAFGASLSDARVRGPLHLSTGQEAVAAGVCINLSVRDLLTSTHRGHGHTIAKGASLETMMCELFGRATGFNRGKGGSMHIADFSVGMLGANGVDGVAVDGNDVFAVDLAASSLIKIIKAGEGPKFLHAVTYRFKGHVSVDPATYRDGEEVDRALEDDPIPAAAEKLKNLGIAPEELKRIISEAEAEVSAAVEAAGAAPWPERAAAYTDIQDTGDGRWLG